MPNTASQMAFWLPGHPTSDILQHLALAMGLLALYRTQLEIWSTQETSH